MQTVSILSLIKKLKQQVNKLKVTAVSFLTAVFTSVIFATYNQNNYEIKVVVLGEKSDLKGRKFSVLLSCIRRLPEILLFTDSHLNTLEITKP